MLFVEGLASSVLTTLKWSLTFFVTRFFNDVRDVFGDAICYWIFAGFCLLGMFFIYFVPETKGKSLEELENPKKKTKKARTLSLCLAEIVVA